ncbi:UvrD-helicase domain-containing protein [Chitinimonas sp. PSY-7]|uniref:UvrD-helicase domain-containing protein n=1 Tax=Chitinimonas sp. PSY-7 TaxID=3459088 RepID=UPI00404000D8
MLIDAAQLTAEQTAIVAMGQRNQLVFATAGSGKSTLLAHWVLARLAQGATSDRILCTTFSNTGRKRLEILLQACGVNAPKVHTVHAVGFAACKRLVDTGWLHSMPKVLNPAEPDDADILRGHLFATMEKLAETRRDFDAIDPTNQNCDDLLHLFDRIKAERKFADFSSEDWHDEWAAERLGIEERTLVLYIEFERLRRQHGFYTFADLIHEPLQLLAREPEARRDLAGRYDFAVLDEINDLSLAQLQLLRAVLGRKAVMVAVGDESQCIHAQQGADPSLMREQFVACFQDLHEGRLSGSFRFGPELAYAMNQFMQRAQPAPTVVCRSLSKQPTRIVRMYRDDEPEAVVGVLKKVLDEGRALHDYAVLFRTPADAIATEYALITGGIAYQYVDTPPFGQRNEEAGLLGLLAMGGGRLQRLPEARRVFLLQAAMGLLAPGLSRAVDPQTGRADWLQQGIRQLAQQPSLLTDFDYLLRAAEKLRDTYPDSPQARRRAERLIQHRAALLGLEDDAPAAASLITLLEVFEVKDELGRMLIDREKLTELRHAFQQTIDFFDRQGWGVAAAIAALEKLNSHTARRTNRHGAQLLSYTQAKGHEWSVVILPSLSRDKLPRRQQGNWLDSARHSLTERRLFYVAATRAKDALVLIAPQDEALKASMRQAQYSAPPADHRASRFLYELQLRAARDAAKPA